MKKKSGFGLMEVMVAAVVLAFLIVGLNILQKGNRESVLRVRARDAANIVAQHILDSLSSVGLNSLVEHTVNGDKIVFPEPGEDGKFTYYFDGKPQLDKSPGSGYMKSKVEYTVQVKLLDEAPDDVRSAIDSTDFTRANRVSSQVIEDREKNTFAKGLEATISWGFKSSTQSITMAKVVR